MDHHSDHGHMDAETRPWPMGWALAALAGLAAFALATLIGAASAPAGGIIGLVSFAVFGALMGSGGVQRTSPAHHDHGDAHDHSGGHH